MYSGLQLLSLRMHKDSMAQDVQYFISEMIVKSTSSQRSTQAKVSAQVHCSPLPVVKVPESTHSQMKKIQKETARAAVTQQWTKIQEPRKKRRYRKQNTICCLTAVEFFSVSRKKAL